MFAHATTQRVATNPRQPEDRAHRPYELFTLTLLLQLHTTFFVFTYYFCSKKYVAYFLLFLHGLSSIYKHCTLKFHTNKVKWEQNFIVSLFHPSSIQCAERTLNDFENTFNGTFAG